MCEASQKDVTGKPSRTGKIQGTLFSDVPLGREMRACQQQQSGKECPKHKTHRQRKKARWRAPTRAFKFRMTNSWRAGRKSRSS
jgi:hypothetical protein